MIGTANGGTSQGTSLRPRCNSNQRVAARSRDHDTRRASDTSVSEASCGMEALDLAPLKPAADLEGRRFHQTPGHLRYKKTQMRTDGNSKQLLRENFREVSAAAFWELFGPY